MATELKEKPIPVVTLTKYRDGTYSWSKDETLHGPMGYQEMVALGYWQFGIRRDEIAMSVETLKHRGHDVILFADRYFDSTYPIDYSGMWR